MPVILESSQVWNCPNCPQYAITNEPQPHTRFHACAGLHGLTAPLVRSGTRCEVKPIVREDYVGSDIVTTDPDGRPIAGILTTRDDGQDVAAYAPHVNATGGV